MFELIIIIKNYNKPIRLYNSFGHAHWFIYDHEGYLFNIEIQW